MQELDIYKILSYISLGRITNKINIFRNGKNYLKYLFSVIFNNYPAKSRGISPDT